VFPVGWGGEEGPDFVEIGGAAGLVELATVEQEVFDYEEIEAGTVLEEFPKAIENDAMSWEDEEFGLDRGFIQEFGCEDTGTEEGFFTIEVKGQGVWGETLHEMTSALEGPP